MFGSNILDVAIGLALIYLLLSLVASGVHEAAEAIVKSRAVELERGIRSLLDDPEGHGMARNLYEHPLVSSLYPGKYEVMEKRFRGQTLPDYIPARSFAVALLDMTVRGTDVGPYAAQQTHPDMSIASLRSSVSRIPSVFVQRAVLSAIDAARGDINRVQANLEEWFDTAMDRVSGQYKRRTQFWLFGIGLATTVILNVNSIAIADYLSHNAVAREALVSRAQQIRTDSTYQRLIADPATIDRATARAAYEDLQSLKLPIGWDRQLPMPPSMTGSDAFFFRLKQVFGLLITAFAIMLGAPFWFDLLNKFMVIRSTVKPAEKSPEEGSEDRPKGKSKQKSNDSALAATEAALAARNVAGNVPGNTASNSGNVSSTPGESATSNASSAVVTLENFEPPHTVQEWAEGQAHEGIL